MKHIYIINNGSKAAQYGIGTHIKQIINCLKLYTATIKVTIVLLDSHQNEIQEIYEEGIRFLMLPNIVGGEKYIRFERYARSIIYTLLHYMNNQDELIFHFHYIQHSWLIKRFKQIFPNSHVILTIHYLSWSITLEGNIIRFRSILSRAPIHQTEFDSDVYEDYRKEKKTFENVDSIICLSNDTKNILSSIYEIPEYKIKLIYNGLEKEKIFVDTYSKKKLKLKLSFKVDEKIIIYVGRLDKAKGISYLIESFQKLITQIENVHLVIIGSGNFNFYLNKCKNISSKVTFTGVLNKDELYEYYRIADVGVLPSFHEQCSYVAIEMMMFRIPWIGTDGIGIREMILDNYFVPLEYKEDEIIFSVDKLYTLLLKILNEKQKMRTKSYTKYENKYSIEKMKKELFSLYKLNVI